MKDNHEAIDVTPKKAPKPDDVAGLLPTLRLYVWNNPYPVPYGSSLVFVVAENLRAARKQASDAKCYSYGEYDNGRAPKVSNLGKPTRVLDLPCAEWHQWSE